MRPTKLVSESEEEDQGGDGRSFRERLLERAADAPPRDAEALLGLAATLLGRRAALTPQSSPGMKISELPLPGDVLVRSVPRQGVRYKAVILSERPELAWELKRRGVTVEAGGDGLYVEVAEVPNEGNDVRTVGRRLTDAWRRMPAGQSVYRFRDEHEEDYREEDDDTDDDRNPLHDWVADHQSIVFLVGDGHLFVLPSSTLGVITPPEKLAKIDWGRVVVANDLGPLLGLPAVAAGASRVFRAGPRLGVMLDAGRNPQRQPAAVYLDHLAARVRDLGLSEVRTVILIHRHADHANELARVVQDYGIKPEHVVIPHAYDAQQPDDVYEATMRALRARFGASWKPADLKLQPATPSGTLVRGRYTLGDATFEFLADSAKLKLPRHTDAASLLVRVTRRGERNAVVVLGDFRGADLESLHGLMDARAWSETFRDVRLIDGFSHHRGAMTAADVPGIMRLLEATLLKNGKLTVTLQTDPGQHVQARADTLEFMRRIGVEVVETNVGTQTASGVQATSGGARPIGPAATVYSPIRSPLVAALERIARLEAARETLELWGPHVARVNKAYDLQSDLRTIERSLEELRTTTGAALLAAAQVRTASAPRGQQPVRDYATGTAGAAFTASVARIPATTAAETAIGTTGFEQLRLLREVPERDVPLRVQLTDALENGRFTKEAFRYMVSQLDPATQKSIFTGPRGGPAGELTVMRRVRAQFGFQQMLGDMETMSVAHLSPGGRVAARGVAGVLLAIEIGNLVAQGVEAYRISKDTARRRNVAPFLRRIAFWRQLGVNAAEVAIDDGVFGTDESRDPAAIDEGLKKDRWNFLLIEHTDARPALSDAAILRLGVVLGQMIRSYDEYATLFEDSSQDAIRFAPGAKNWTDSRWEICVGSFETSGENHITERWVELPLLTETMRALTRRVVANTTELLGRIGRNVSADTQEYGTLTEPPGTLLYRARGSALPFTTFELKSHAPPAWSGRAGVTPKSKYYRITWDAMRPQYFVWEVDGSSVRVSGADFPTYARLRDFKKYEYWVGTRGDVLNWTYEDIVGNATGDAWAVVTDIERI